jgi:hypothetical protein
MSACETAVGDHRAEGPFGSGDAGHPRTRVRWVGSGKDARIRNCRQHARFWRGRLHHCEDEEPLEADSKMRISSVDDGTTATDVRFTRGV